MREITSAAEIPTTSSLSALRDIYDAPVFGAAFATLQKTKTRQISYGGAPHCEHVQLAMSTGTN
jgi:hypothetical protein